MEGPPLSGWLTKKEAAAYAKVSVSTIERAIRRGDLQHTKTAANGHVRIRLNWLQTWLKPRNAGPMILPLLLDDRVQAILTALVAAVGMAALCNCYVHVCVPGHVV